MFRALFRRPREGIMPLHCSLCDHHYLGEIPSNARKNPGRGANILQQTNASSLAFPPANYTSTNGLLSREPIPGQGLTCSSLGLWKVLPGLFASVEDIGVRSLG